jgi:hypothetical protein
LILYLHPFGRKLEYQDSINKELDAEKASHDEDSDNIDIQLDARHGCRKNAKDSSISVLGENTPCSEM